MPAPIPFSRPHVSGAGEARIIVLALALAALIGWNAYDWVQPDASQPIAVFGPSATTVTHPANDTVAARFGICGGGRRYTCVVDGDTFWLAGRKIRIADIDTPEISSPRCPAELQRGNRATQRLVALLNQGPFALEQQGRAEDRYGRALYVVKRGGESIGGALVDEGLAVWYGNGRPNWC